jgi:hypothetical protein
VAVGRSGYSPKGDSLGIYDRRTFDALFPPVYRTSTGFLATARGFGNAPIYCYIGQPQPDGPVVGFERHLAQFIHQPAFDPLIAPSTQGGSRARFVGDPPVGAAEDQDLNELLEDRPIGYAGSMAAQGMLDLSFGQQGGELLPDGFDDAWLECGHVGTLLHRETSAPL